MRLNEMFPSRFFRAADIPPGRELRLRIADVAMEAVGEDGDEKPTLIFDGQKQALVLNKTNAEVLVEAFGDDSDTWVGREVLLFPTQTRYGGKKVPCLRLKVAETNGESQAAADEIFG
jgi:hypothetical protein